MFAAAPSSFAALLGGASFLQRAIYAVEDVVELLVALHFAVPKLQLAVGQRAINVDLERSLFFALILAALVAILLPNSPCRQWLSAVASFV